tara:strand:+ start:361 stop:522 length:162 start_codon:yes stop_codon:yes gene_type:complete
MTDNSELSEGQKDEVSRILKKYKKLKKYQKSNLFTIQKLSGKSTVIDKLLENE